MNETNITIAQETTKKGFDFFLPYFDKFGEIIGKITGSVVQKGVESGIVQNNTTAKLLSIVILLLGFFLVGKISNKAIKYLLIFFIVLLVLSIGISIFV